MQVMQTMSIHIQMKVYLLTYLYDLICNVAGEDYYEIAYSLDLMHRNVMTWTDRHFCCDYGVKSYE